MTETTQEQSIPTSLKIILAVLTGLVVISLALNMYLIYQWNQAQQQFVNVVTGLKPVVAETFDNADKELAAFQESTLTFNVEIDQELPVNAEIPFNETIEIPVKMTIPFNERIQTTVNVDPFNSGFEIRIDLDIPIDMEFPIDQVIPITIERTIPISTTVPLQLAVPININIADTDLAPFIDELRKGLTGLESSVDQTLSEIE